MKVIGSLLLLLVAGIALFAYLFHDDKGRVPREAEVLHDDKGRVSREAEVRQFMEQMERRLLEEQRRVKPIEDRFADGVRRASAVVLYEGLPHQTFEKGMLEEERRTKAVQELHGYPFYRELLNLKDEDAKRLSTVLGDPDTLGAVAHPSASEAKKCGGFHPDYAIEWHQGGNRFQALICFGCREVRLFSSGGYAQRDFSEKVDAMLKDLLKGYRKNRPAERTPKDSAAAASASSAAPYSAMDSESLYQQALAMESSGNAQDAVRIYRRSARAGSGKAAKRLGEIYDKGVPGVSRDYAESLQWYEMARQLGETVDIAGKR